MNSPTPVAGYDLIDVRPVQPRIGAEIRGLDLADGINDAQFAEIHRAFLEHQVIFFKGQTAMDPDIQIAFARRFGDLHAHPAAPHLEGRPEVFVIHAHRESKVANGEGWHSDVSCDGEPPSATMLQIQQTPPEGGDTLFSSMYAAWESFSEPMQTMLLSLSARHESEHVYRGRYSDRGVDDTGVVYPEAVHPVIRTHPETGRKALYVNAGFTRRILELTSPESKNMLKFLFRQCENPMFQVRFHWELNDVALWDNRCLQHHALWDYWPNERKGHRVTIKGDAPFLKP
jgi:taurine dioxygenase